MMAPKEPKPDDPPPPMPQEPKPVPMFGPMSCQA
jgi:hypothetical protein